MRNVKKWVLETRFVSLPQNYNATDNICIVRTSADCCRTAAMVDAVYRGNIEELLSVLNHLKKYIIAFVVIVLLLLSVVHFSKYSAPIVPLVTVSLVLLPAAYYTAVLVLKFGSSFVPSSRSVSTGS